MADDRVKILCTRCKGVFRVKLSHIRDGSQSQCNGCDRLITFDKDSQDLGVQRAFKDARALRKLLAAEQEQRAKPGSKPPAPWRRRS